MKVLFIHPAYTSQFTELAHFLNRVQGYETACLTEMAHGETIRKDGVPIPYFGYTPDGNGEAGQTCWYLSCYEDALRHGKGVADTLDQVLDLFPADLVIGHASFGTTFYIKEMTGLPVISYVELPGYHMAWARKEYPALREHVLLHASFESLVFASAMKSDAVVVPSAHARSFFPEELKGKTHVLMEGFSLPPLFPDKKTLRKEAGLPETGKVVGFAGRTLEAVRGFDVFAETLQRLMAQGPDIHALVIGSEETVYGNELSYLEGKSFKQHVLDNLDLPQERIVYKEYLEHGDYHRHLQAMDLILFPQFEGAANWGLFEAMASGVPVLASNRCFVPEIISHGHNGFMADPEDSEGMVDLSLFLLKNPEVASQAGERARETIGHFYSVEQWAAGYLDLIDRIMAESGAARSA